MENEYQEVRELRQLKELFYLNAKALAYKQWQLEQLKKMGGN